MATLQSGAIVGQPFVMAPQAGYGPNTGYGYELADPPKRRGGFTFQFPRSAWFYICLFMTCGLILTVGGIVVTLGILDIIHWASNGGIQGNPVVAYDDAYNYAGTVKAPSAVADNTATAPAPVTTTTTTVLTSDQEARLAGLEERLRTLTLEPGPKGDQGARGIPGTCSADQCNTASSSLGTASVLRITGDKANQMPATIAQNPVSLRISEGDAEIVNGGLATKGPITTQSMFASPSDERVKSNITARSYRDSIDSILKLRPVEYDYNDEWVEHVMREHSSEIGLIAQEVKKVYPFSVVREAVYVPGLGMVEDFNMLNYHSIISDLVGSITYLALELEKSKDACGCPDIANAA